VIVLIGPRRGFAGSAFKNMGVRSVSFARLVRRNSMIISIKRTRLSRSCRDQMLRNSQGACAAFAWETPRHSTVINESTRNSSSAWPGILRLSAGSIQQPPLHLPLVARQKPSSSHAIA